MSTTTVTIEPARQQGWKQAANPRRSHRWPESKRLSLWSLCMLACSIAVILFAAGSPQDTAASEPSAEPVYKVVSPVGESIVKMTAMAPRLDTLAGKTICMVWNHAFKADVTLPAIAEALKKQYPGVKIVPYAAMPVAPLPETPGAPRKESEALQAAFKQTGCHAAIIGNGG